MDSSYFDCDACGRNFSGPGPLHFHARACPQGKKRRQGLLEKANEKWAARKKTKTHASLEDLPSQHNALGAMPVATEATSSTDQITHPPLSQAVEPAYDTVGVDSTLSRIIAAN